MAAAQVAGRPFRVTPMLVVAVAAAVVGVVAAFVDVASYSVAGDFVDNQAYKLNDFSSKRAAILAGIGYGWLPESMIGAELAARRLRPLRWSRTSSHVFHPRLYHRGKPGPAARQLIASLTTAGLR